MSGRIVVVLPFLGDDRRYGCNGSRIIALERGKLLLKATECDALYSNASGSHGVRAKQAGNCSEYEAT